MRLHGAKAAVWLAAALAVSGYLSAYRLNAERGEQGEGEAAMKDTIVKSDAEWKLALTPEQYRVLRQNGTERPFSGQYWKHSEPGVYVCAGCGDELFGSDTKFDSGCGWPSFHAPTETNRIAEHKDDSLGMVRTEIRCAKCGGHLGHVFNDGPRPTGLRYCINSAALKFDKRKSEPTKQSKTLEIATLGAGCFWCVEAAFEMLDGVESVKSGYMGGQLKNPTYKQVCSGKTGHAEVAQISYDPKRVSFEDLLWIFWIVHDPTTLNRQGGDVGTQYRSAIFYHTPAQKAAAETAKKALEKSGKFKSPIVTEITEASEFYEAEDYHQDYYNNHADAPYCRAVIAPKLKKVRAATKP